MVAGWRGVEFSVLGRSLLPCAVGAHMKRPLLGSTMLAALGLIVRDTSAADGFKLQIGGSYQNAAGAVFSEDLSSSSGVSAKDVRNYVFKQDVEVDFSGKTTLANGLTVGASIELNAQTDAGDQIDKVYAFVGGSFGQVRFGDNEEAYDEF